MAGHPSNGQGRGEHVLACMRALGPNIKEEVVNMWDTVIPKLQAYISGEFEGFESHTDWLFLMFLNQTCRALFKHPNVE